MSNEHTPASTIEDSTATASTALDVVIDLLEEVRKLVSPGKARAVNIRYKDRVIAALPVALTVAGTIAVGVAAAVVSRLVIDIEREG